MSFHIRHPLGFDARGRTATVGEDAHVRQLIEAVLFTAPGERVGRPDFGSGLGQLVFSPGGDQVAAATAALVQGALQRWLGDVIAVESVEASAEDSTLRVTVRYVLRRSGEAAVATFASPAEGGAGA